MNPTIETFNTKELRSTLRKKRRSLTPFQQRNAATRLRKQLGASRLLLRAKHIALYLANDGEIDPVGILQQLWRYRRYCYLPVLHPLKEQQLAFCLVTPTTKFTYNRFGIAEPIYGNSVRIAPKRLSLVLMPLVAFDAKGNRIGMGGGYYDRTFAFRTRDRKSTLPLLVGLAHEFQKLEAIRAERWDIPLCGVITDQRVYRFLE